MSFIPGPETYAMASESIRDKLAKRPLLLIAVTSSLSFGIQLIPLKAVTSSLCKNWKLALSSAYPFRQLNFMESSWQLFTPPVLFAVVCLVILFILYTSQRDNEEIGPDDQNVHSLIESKKSSITRTVTLGQSIFDHFIPPADDEDILKLGSIETHASLVDHEITKDLISVTPHQQENTDNVFLSLAHNSMLASSEEKDVKSNSEKTQVSARASGTKSKLSRPATSRPATSTGLMDSKDPSTSVNTKLNYLPKSFRENRSKVEKQELSKRVGTYLGSSGRQIQQDGSLLTEQLAMERKDLKRCSKPRIESSPVSISLSFNDANSNTGIKQKVFSKAEVNDDRDLTEAEVNDRINAYLYNVENGFRPRKQKTKPSHQRKRQYLKTYSEGSSTQELMKSGSRETSESDLKHTSSQLIRGDSLANDNQKFDSFLQNFRNELRLQKQRSNLRHYFANDI